MQECLHFLNGKNILSKTEFLHYLDVFRRVSKEGKLPEPS